MKLYFEREKMMAQKSPNVDPGGIFGTDRECQWISLVDGASYRGLRAGILVVEAVRHTRTIGETAV
jgi:hypothetical protein